MNPVKILALAVVLYVLSFVGLVWAVAQICSVLGLEELIIPLIVLIICLLFLARTKIKIKV